jgi:hypothetical protein
MNYGERQRAVKAVMVREGVGYHEACSILAQRGAQKRRARKEWRDRCASPDEVGEWRRRLADEATAAAMRRWRAACGEADE